jgi:tRNA modification GTPase
MHDDTIFAIASGAGRAAIAVMRISGPDSAAILRALGGRLPPPRRASLRRLRDAAGKALDHALVLWLPAPASYTGEASAELHLHGGRAVIEGVADALVTLGARPAEPGEFTRRAFLNGRMDLIEAEAVGDLVEAETSAQRVQALRQLDGALGAIYHDWADRLRVLLAQQEALIDFPDEDLPPETEALALAELAVLTRQIGGHLDDGRRGERLREGLVFAVTGPPNVGKSSLVNALAERDVAIVAATPGTTRDALETRVVLGGVPVTLVDTAGLREAQDAIEAEGVRRARARAAAADLVIVVGEAGDCGTESSPPPLEGGGGGVGVNAPQPVRARPLPPTPSLKGRGRSCYRTHHPHAANRQQDRPRRHRPAKRPRHQRPHRRGHGPPPRAPRRRSARPHRDRRPPAAHPRPPSRRPGGGRRLPRPRRRCRPAGAARRGPSPGAARPRPHHRADRRRRPARHHLPALLHRQIGYPPKHIDRRRPA